MRYKLRALRISESPTPYRVICSDGCDTGRQVSYYLTIAEFRRQNAERKGHWECPACGGPAQFDELNFRKELKP